MSPPVAPLVGAWIETEIKPITIFIGTVAPLVGAWIETSIITNDIIYKESHPSWVRGLKRFNMDRRPHGRGVAPLVGAWIETQMVYLETMEKLESHPSWVRGLKPAKAQFARLQNRSHPSWVRGLKPQMRKINAKMFCRTPRGCVD